jgi:ESCRT-II complex subunit VPS36
LPLLHCIATLTQTDASCLPPRQRATPVAVNRLLQQVGLPLRVRKFPSGVTVVQGSQFSDKQLCSNIEQLLQRKSQGGPAAPTAAPMDIDADMFPGAAAVSSTSSSGFVPGLGPALSAADVSAALLLPLTLAKEALLVAESSGVLCRDDGPEGLRFFRNLFREAQPVAF